MLSASDVTRIIYLGTYTGYDGYLTRHKHGRLSKKEMEPLMQLSKTAFKDFWRSAQDAGILHEEADGIRVDAQYFRKGPLQHQSRKKKATLTEGSFIRVYLSSVRDLYRRTPARTHKVLSYLYRAVPFLNQKFNVLCRNPYESERDELILLSHKEFFQLMGHNSEHSKAVLSDVKGFSFTLKIDGETVTQRAIIEGDPIKEGDHQGIYINPRLLYAGTSWEEIGGIHGERFRREG